jgi:hypothetical protein
MGKLTISHLCVRVSCRVPQKWPDRRRLGGLVAAKLDQTGEKPMRVGSLRMGNLFQHPKSWSPASMGIWNSRPGGLGLRVWEIRIARHVLLITQTRYGGYRCSSPRSPHTRRVRKTSPHSTLQISLLTSLAVTGRHESTVVTSDERLQGANNYCQCGKQKRNLQIA